MMKEKGKLFNLCQTPRKSAPALTGTKESCSSFDAAIGNIVNITVGYDMGWSKRGNGRSYDSLTGYGTIIA